MKPIQAEEAVYQAVERGELEIDDQGRIWRIGCRRGDRWRGGAVFLACERRRAESSNGRYYQVRVMVGGVCMRAMAHRLVWRHFRGPIPEGMTVNHIDGNPLNNRPENLELATYSDQVIHSMFVLGHLRSRNAMGRFESRGAE